MKNLKKKPDENWLKISLAGNQQTVPKELPEKDMLSTRNTQLSGPGFMAE